MDPTPNLSVEIEEHQYEEVKRFMDPYKTV